MELVCRLLLMGGKLQYTKEQYVLAIAMLVLCFSSQEPSCVSMKSNRSIEQPVPVQNEDSFTWSR